MAAFLALASAALYGIVDFAGGLLSRRAHFAVVTLLGQTGGLLPALVVAFAVPAPDVRGVDVTWGALSGLGSAVAMTYPNRGLSRGRHDRGGAGQRAHRGRAVRAVRCPPPR
ncbi:MULTISPECIES: hypothetical protein [Streptomyces]|uniref:hypothetical protein n=1 Tax=Streptomyces TaxID=1883 RepID=UPI001F1A9ED5|nr:hypothetical protein [Streptomyces sp. AMCC400023]